MLEDFLVSCTVTTNQNGLSSAYFNGVWVRLKCHLSEFLLRAESFPQLLFARRCDELGRKLALNLHNNTNINTALHLSHTL